MPARKAVQVIGADRAAATMRAAADDLADLSDGSAEAARVIAARARAIAPVRSGRLAASIQAEGSAEGATVWAEAPYAGVQEWGWPARHIPAQPYLVPSAEDTEAVWVEAYRSEVETIVDRIQGA